MVRPSPAVSSTVARSLPVASPSPIAAITGEIVDSGYLVGGIAIDSASTIAGAPSAIAVTGSTFTGGISNAGKLSASSVGITVHGVTDFSGGITNSGVITGGFGIDVSKDQGFTGNVVNSATGAITAKYAGILVSRVGQFGTANPGGGIVNAGTITVTARTASGIFVAENLAGTSGEISEFSGGITNTGTISANGSTIEDAIFVGGAAFDFASVTLSSFSGGITNQDGTFSAGGDGIIVGGFAFDHGSVTVTSFTGGIDNNGGTISAGAGGIIVGGTAYSGGTVTVSNFSGGITNSGNITAGGVGAGGVGIGVGGRMFGTPSATHALVTISTFSGGITNSGTISAGQAGIGVGGTTPLASVISDFSGGITNTGIISAEFGIAVSDDHTFAGGIDNNGAVTGSVTGIGVFYVENFSGGVTNTGTVAGATGVDLIGTSGVHLFDSGAIVGTSGTAIELDPTINNYSLTLAGNYSLTGDISGFVEGDTIDLANVSGGNAGTATLLAGNVLQVVEDGKSYDLDFNPNQSFLGESFVLGSDGSGGTTVTLGPAATPPTELVVTIDGGPFASGVVTQTTGGDPIASSYDAFLAFGDSDIDSGYFLTHQFSTYAPLQDLYQTAVADGGGLPTTIGSQMNSVLLAQYIGKSAIPIGETGGTNYAASGATVTGSLPYLLAPSIDSQVDTYLSSVDNHADPNALYLFSGGGNDAVVASDLYPSSNATDIQDQINFMEGEANAFAATIEKLHQDGAQHILIDDFNGQGILVAAFNTTLWSDLNSTGTPFLVDDDDAVVEGIYLNASGYDQATGADITNVEGAATINADPSLISSGWSLYATPADQEPNAATQYLFADNEHLAGPGQLAEANYTENLINTGVPTVGETLTANPYVTTGLNTNGAALTTTFQWQRGCRRSLAQYQWRHRLDLYHH